MWGAFELASFRDSEIAALPFKYRVLDGLFQSSGMYMRNLISKAKLKRRSMQLCGVVGSLL
jgi:hypothetical protein